jgi:hypothetical protein
VARAYKDGYEGAHKDAFIGLGTAPLEDSQFRSALFEQLGESRLEAAVTTDICGKKDSHATRLDAEAVEGIKKARLHRKVATAVFFESNGGQAKAEATVPEIRLAVAEPGLDIGNIETVIEALTESSYYLVVERNRYRFSFRENLNKRFADRRASIQPKKIEERIKAEVQKVFAAGPNVERFYFPEKSSQVPDRPVLTLVILPFDPHRDERKIEQFVETMTRDYGTSSRTFKSALIWCAPDPAGSLHEDARRLLAWEDIQSEQLDLMLDDAQKTQLSECVSKARRDLKETVWRNYKTLFLLGKDNKMRTVDLGLITSSHANSITELILNQLTLEDVISKGISPNFLGRNWPPAFTEWSTKSVRDAFFASPLFPRLLVPDTLRDTIAKGVQSGVLAYVGKSNGDYKPFAFNTALMPNEVEFSEDVFIISKETADAHLKAKASAEKASERPTGKTEQPGETDSSKTPQPTPQHPIPGDTDDGSGKTARKIVWRGEIPAQKWSNFYLKVISKLAASKGLKLSVTLEASPDGGVAPHRVEEIKMALRELGLGDEIDLV